MGGAPATLSHLPYKSDNSPLSRTNRTTLPSPVQIGQLSHLPYKSDAHLSPAPCTFLTAPHPLACLDAQEGADVPATTGIARADIADLCAPPGRLMSNVDKQMLTSA